MDGLERLADGTYRGRGLALGPAPDGDSLTIVYWITGRSERSRNRRLVEAADGTVRTEFIDAGRGDEPALVVYPLLMSRSGTHVVSNGEQTEPILEALHAGETLERALRSWRAEPDDMSTPRIVGAAEMDTPEACRLGIVRQRTATERCGFAYDGLPPGTGRCVTTYAGRTLAPAPFAGDPFVRALRARSGGDLRSVPGGTVRTAAGERGRPFRRPRRVPHRHRQPAGLTAGDAYAERCRVHAGSLMRVPERYRSPPRCWPP